MSKRRRYKTAKRQLAKVQTVKAEAEERVDEAFARVMKADPREVNDIFADRIKTAAVAPTSLVGKPNMKDVQLHQTYVDSDKVDPWRNSHLIPPYKTHSIGIKPHPSSVRERLKGVLQEEGLTYERLRDVVLEEGLTAGQISDDLKKLMDDRPVIDRLHQATFNPPIGLQWIKDHYALRTTLRKAHCFTVDAETSKLMVDFAQAIAPDIDAARMLAVPPFPTTWFQIDNHARLKRALELGHKLTKSASGADVIREVGWLITTTGPNEYCMTYACEVDQGMMIPPLSWNWSTAPGNPTRTVVTTGGTNEQTKRFNDRLLFGMYETNVNVADAWLFPAPFQSERKTGSEPKHWLTHNEMDLMLEIAGELRHLFGLLIALGATQHGAVTSTSPQPVSQSPPVIAKGKPLFPIEHKLLTIKLSKRHTVEKVTMRAITGIKHRWHEVRSHFRTKYNTDGTVKWRIPIKSHARGDERLGRVEKTYKIEK